MDIELPQEYNAKHYRIRCQGHIINLATNAFLTVTDPNNIDEDEDIMPDIAVKEVENWRKDGPLGKLHNTCVKIHSSTQLLQQFKRVSRGLVLPRDNCTRWLSWFRLIERAILLQKPICQFYELCMEGNDKDKLTEEDWDLLQKASSITLLGICYFEC